MELENAFTVPGAPDDVFAVLLDLERVATCMPGATLTGRDGDEYRGTLKLKVGPIGAAYEGSVTVAAVDRGERAATLRAAGKELNGQGGAQATVHARVDGNGEGSRVSVSTEVQIQGRAAQFGRGALAEVTQRVIDQFARNLEAQLVAAGPPSAFPGRPQPAPPPPAETLDVLSVAVPPAVRKAVPAAVALLAALVLGILVGRRGLGRS